jgi:hypothetical protein
MALRYFDFKMLQAQADFAELIENLAMEAKQYLDPKKDHSKIDQAERKINDLKTMIRQAEMDYYKDCHIGPTGRN